MYVLDHKIPRYLWKLRDVLTEEYLEWLEINYNKITDNKRRLAKNATGCFVLNLNKAIKSKSKYIGLTLSEGDFSKERIINGKATGRKVSYTYTRSLLDFLDINNYGEISVGGEVTDYQVIKGKWTAVSFSTSYFKMYKTLENLYNIYVKPKKSFDTLEDTLRLRYGKKKHNEEFDMSEAQEGLIDFLDRFNTLSRNTDVTFKGTRLDTQIYKVFNEDFKSGGRSYMNCNYQRLSSDDRKKIEISGKKVVCYDFKGFEVGLAYSMNQEIMEMEDPYYTPELIMEGYDKDVARKISKLALIICLNVDNKNDARLAINKSLSDNLNINKLYKEGKIPDKTIPVTWLIECVTENHHLIENRFFDKQGLHIQNVGSAVNDYILDYMMQNHNQLVMQVHDDFAVIEEYENILKEVMFKAYENVLGFTDNCKITKEY